MEESYSIKLAAIYNEFEYSKDSYLDTVALVRYHNNSDFFEVVSGKYIGNTSFSYNEIKVSDKNILSYPNEIKMVTKVMDRKNIYFFDTEFFKEKINKYNNSIKDVLLDLMVRLNNIYLHKNNDGSIFTAFKFNEKVPNTDKLYDVASGSINDYVDEVFETKQIEEDVKGYIKKFIASVSDLDSLFDINDNINVLPLTNNEEKIVFSPKDYNFVREKKKEREINHFANNQIVNEMISSISNKIVGQENAIKTLVSNIYFNQVLIDNLEKEKEIDPSRLDSSKVAILLDGETGTGKTAIEKEIARMLNLPIVITNANSFSETGYVGPTITDILENLVDQANGDVSKAERGIVVLDEIDKVASKDEVYGKDMDKGVQEELLSFIGGGEYDVKVGEGFFGKMARFDTSKLTFILSGAFTDLREE